MNIDLTGRRCVVGGASRGIGLATARELAALGADVVCFARDSAALESAVASLAQSGGQRHGFIAVDYTNAEGVAGAAQRALAEHGPVQILVNNTGGPAPGAAHEAAPEAFRAGFEAHVIAAQTLVQAFLPSMKEARYGRIVNVLSTSVKEPIPNLGVSNTIRGAMAQWSKTLSRELAPFGVTVNNLLPGYTDTERLRSLFETLAKKSGATPEEIAEETRGRIPSGRFADPAETGGAIAFLCAPAAAYINGINLPVDGGRLGCL